MSYDTDAEMRLRDILAELERKGMSDLKNLIEDERIAAEYSKVNREFVVPSNYFFFIGGSRDEAVEYSKILAWCLYEFGMLETERLQIWNANDLIGNSAEDTILKISRAFEKSKKHALMLDRLYDCLAFDDIGESKFKKEAFGTLVSLLEKPESKRNCCLIFTGSKDGFMKFMDIYRGFKAHYVQNVVRLPEFRESNTNGETV